MLTWMLIIAQVFPAARRILAGARAGEKAAAEPASSGTQGSTKPT
jgi:hypothetical protein